MACGCAQRHASEEAGEGGCGDCRTWEEKLYWKRFLPLHFCQILLPGTEFHKQLVIPKKFSRNARAMLPPQVTLRGPSGASWPTLTTSRGDEMYFLDGWEAFVVAYSLQSGDVLIFKFDGNSVFDVLIFDGDNLCERELAYFVQHTEHAKPFAENQRKRISSEVSTQEHDDDHAHKRSKYFRVYGRSRRKNSVPHVCVSSSENTSHPPAEHPNVIVQNAPSDKEPQNTAEINGNCATPAPESNDATGNKTDGNGDDHATIRNFFSADARPKRAHRSTPVKNYSALVGRRNQTKASAKKVTSSAGRPDRALRSTPVKSYSALAGRRIQTKASAQKVTSSAGRPERQLGASEPAEAIAWESATMFNRKYVSPEGAVALEEAQQHMNEDSFITVMHSSTIDKRFVLCIPKAWRDKHFSRRSQDVFLRIGDKTWLVRLTYSPLKNAGYITNGWKQFVEENQLKEYDICLFTFATKKDGVAMLDVSVFRAASSPQPR